MLQFLALLVSSCICNTLCAQRLPTKRALLERQSMMIEEQKLIIDIVLKVANSTTGPAMLDPYSDIMAKFNSTINRRNLVSLQISLMKYQVDVAKNLSILSKIENRVEFNSGNITRINYWEDYHKFHRQFEEYRTIIKVKEDEEIVKEDYKLIHILVPSLVGFVFIVIVILLVLYKFVNRSID